MSSKIRNDLGDLSEYQIEVVKYNAIFSTDEAVLAFRYEGITVEVRFDRYVFSRPEYFFRVYGPTGPIKEPILHGGHLAGGTDDKVSLPKAMKSLATFLLAWQDASRPEHENYSSFDNDMRHALDWDKFLPELTEFLGGNE